VTVSMTERVILMTLEMRSLEEFTLKRWTEDPFNVNISSIQNNYKFKINYFVNHSQWFNSKKGLQARLIGCEGVNFGSDFRASSKAFLVLECYAQLTVDPGQLS